MHHRPTAAWKHWKISFPVKAIPLLSLAFCLLLSLVPPLRVDPGISEPRPFEAYLGNVFPKERPSINVSFLAEPAFPNVNFYTPCQMQKDPVAGRIFVTEKRGRIIAFDTENGGSNPKTVLNIEDRVSQGAGARGIMGFILHHEFGQVGSPNKDYFYLYYHYIPEGGDLLGQLGYRRLSRFTYDRANNQVPRNTEQVLIQQFTTSHVHNGGGMAWGNDKNLYLGIGDGGTCCEQFTSQRLDSFLLAGVLRLDVDMRGGEISHPIRRHPGSVAGTPDNWPESFTANYYIPNDNPWLDPNGAILEEFFSIGLRHPYTLSYDPVRDEFWEGEIGEASFEEINKIEKGANYEWPFLEADKPYRATLAYTPRNILEITGIQKSYFIKLDRQASNSVIGGFVYRGTKYPSLYGKYIFGDHGSGRIWTIDASAEGQYTQDDISLLAEVPGASGGFGIASFATDEKGDEIYIVKMAGITAYGPNGGGEIFRLVPQLEPSVDAPPLLSQTGAFSDLATLTPAEGFIPYKTNSPLWSDGAEKYRWVGIPNNGTFNTEEEQIGNFSENWAFPAGTVFIKHFELAIDEADPSRTTRLETRFVVIGEADDYYAVTYKWNEAQSDAVLLTDRDTREVLIDLAGGGTKTQTWHFPSRTECFACHTAAAGKVLGVSNHQLNGDYTYPSTGIRANQLETWDHLGLFTKGISQVGNLAQAVEVGNSRATLQHQVRSYMDANCAFCHHPNGVEGIFDARISTPLDQANIINAEIDASSSIPGNVILKPGDLEASEIWVRTSTEEGNLMPPVGRSVLDQEFVGTLEKWITQMVPSDPDFSRIGEAGRVETDHRWHTVNLQQSYVDPVVILGPPSYQSNEPATVRVRNVKASSFEVRIDEWENCLDEDHPMESVSYIVIEAGTYMLPNGKRIAAGNTQLSSQWKTLNFPQSFATVPTVFASCVSENEADGVVVRIDDVLSSASEITLKLQEQEGGGGIQQSPSQQLPLEKEPEGKRTRLDLPNLGETLLEQLPNRDSLSFPGAANSKDIALNTYSKAEDTEAFSIELPNAGLHTQEQVSWLAIEPGVNEIGGEFEVVSLDQVPSFWLRIPFFQHYSEKPLVIASIGSYREADPIALRYNHEQLHGGAIRILAEEETCGDEERTHVREKVNFLFAEMGTQLFGKSTEDPEGMAQSRFSSVYDSEGDSENLFSVFPNPVRGNLQIDLNGKIGQTFVVKLFTANGKLVLNQTQYSGSISIPSGTFPPAIYYLHVSSEGIDRMEKILIK